MSADLANAYSSVDGAGEDVEYLRVPRHHHLSWLRLLQLLGSSLLLARDQAADAVE